VTWSSSPRHGDCLNEPGARARSGGDRGPATPPGPLSSSPADRRGPSVRPSRRRWRRTEGRRASGPRNGGVYNRPGRSGPNAKREGEPAVRAFAATPFPGLLTVLPPRARPRPDSSIRDEPALSGGDRLRLDLPARCREIVLLPSRGRLRDHRHLRSVESACGIHLRSAGLRRGGLQCPRLLRRQERAIRRARCWRSAAPPVLAELPRPFQPWAAPAPPGRGGDPGERARRHEPPGVRFGSQVEHSHGDDRSTHPKRTGRSAPRVPWVVRRRPPERAARAGAGAPRRSTGTIRAPHHGGAALLRASVRGHSSGPATRPVGGPCRPGAGSTLPLETDPAGAILRAPS